MSMFYHSALEIGFAFTSAAASLPRLSQSVGLNGYRRVSYMWILYHFWSSCVFVDDWVPDRVKILGTTLGRQGDKVATSITFRILRVNSAGCVQRLMDVTNIVNEEADGIRETLLLRKSWELLHHSCIDKAGLIVALAGDPLLERWDSLINWIGVWLEVRVILGTASLVEIRNVNEVPAWLPGATFSLDFVGKCCAFHKRIAALEVSHGRVGLAVNLEKRVCFC